MSKQYLTTHSYSLPAPAASTDVFALTPSTPTSTLLIASGSSALYIHSTASSSYPLVQTLPHAHPLGCHHAATSADGHVSVTVGFGGEVRLWRLLDSALHLAGDALNEPHDVWASAGEVRHGLVGHGRRKNAAECWAVALSESGRYLAGTSFEGRARVWDLEGGGDVDLGLEEDGEDGEGGVRIEGTPCLVHDLETRGGFGMGVDINADASLLATAHHSGSVYLFALAPGRARLLRSLPSLHAPARTIRFSPAGTLLAAAGDSGHIAVYSITSSGSHHNITGEQVAQLKGHDSWITSLCWSQTGEWIASCAWDGKVRVWSTELGTCVAVLKGPETEKGGNAGPSWSVSWVNGGRGVGEGLAVGGRMGGLRFLREAAGG